MELSGGWEQKTEQGLSSNSFVPLQPCTTPVSMSDSTYESNLKIMDYFSLVDRTSEVGIPSSTSPQAHNYEASSLRRQPSGDGKLHSCSQCDFKAPTLARLTQHIVVHSEHSREIEDQRTTPRTMALPRSRAPSVGSTDLEPGSTEWLAVTSAVIMGLGKLVESCDRMPTQRRILLRCLNELGESLNVGDSGVDVGSRTSGGSVEVESLRCRISSWVEQQLQAMTHFNDSFGSDTHRATPRGSSTPRPDNNSSSSSSDSSSSEETARGSVATPGQPRSGSSRASTSRPVKVVLADGDAGAGSPVAPAYPSIIPPWNICAIMPSTNGDILCCICTKRRHPPTTYRCDSCKVMWNRLVRKCRNLRPTDPAYPKPCSRAEHEKDHPPTCTACKRWRYEQAWIAAKQPDAMPIEPVTPAGRKIAEVDLGLQRSEECKGAAESKRPVKKLRRRGTGRALSPPSA